MLRRVCPALLACVCMFAVLLCLAPMQAQAKSYECNSINIDASVQTDGSLVVSEARTFDFDGSFSLVGVILDPPADGEAVVKNVAVEAEGETTKLKQIAFEELWRTEGGPGAGYYSIDEPYNTVYCFSKYRDCVATVTVKYEYTNAITAYSDVSELYWQFVGKSRDIPYNNITATVTLPVPAGAAPVKGEDVRAWGHGPLDAAVAISDSCETITYSVPNVSESEFAEARVTFPVSWTSKLKPGATAGLDNILEEEQAWADEANEYRMRARIIGGVPAGTSLLLFIFSLFAFFRHGREYRTLFRDEYWRDVPEKGVEPAVVGRICRWNATDTKDFTATLMRLASKGVVRIDRVVTEKDRLLGLGTKTVEDYILTRTGKQTSELTKLESKAYKIVFSMSYGDKNTVSFEDIKKFGKDYPETMVSKMDSWQDALSSEVEKAGVFEKKGEKLSVTLKILAIVLVIIGALVGLAVTESFLPLLAVLPGAIATFVVAIFMRRRSEHAAEINARSQSLKNWFKDFTNLKEAIPTDAKVWGELLIYAYLFGVAKDVVKELQIKVPQLWDDTGFMTYSYWYWNPSGGDAYSGAFDSAIDNTVKLARAAVAGSELVDAIGSSASSGSGGGGGFSGGGGGGFGGGGGGFAR